MSISHDIYIYLYFHKLVHKILSLRINLKQVCFIGMRDTKMTGNQIQYNF